MLSATDILFTLVLSSMHLKPDLREDTDSDSDGEFFSPCSSPRPNSKPVENKRDLHSYQVLLSGTDYVPKCIPHVIHIYSLSEGVTLVQYFEMGKENISANLYETFSNLHTMQVVQVQGDNETLRPAFEKLDTSVKKLCDGLKKMKNNLMENCYKQLSKQWEFMRKKYLDFIKNHTQESLLRAETSTSTLLENLKEILHLISSNDTFLHKTQQHAVTVAKYVKEKLEYYNDFLKVKVFRNFSLGSYPFLRNKTLASDFV